MDVFSRAILDAVEAFESEHAHGPTVSELAISLGIPFEVGHAHLASRLQRQVVLGRVLHSDGRFMLTGVGGPRSAAMRADDMVAMRAKQPAAQGLLSLQGS
jgi:hypothetical protein